MNESEYIEFQFIQETLKKFGYRLHSLFVKEIEGKKLLRTGELRASVNFEVKRVGKTGGELMFTFPNYGRVIEIMFFRRSDNSMKAFMRTSSLQRFEKKNRPRKRSGMKKDTRWYAKTAYGNIKYLVAELMYGLTENVREEMFNRLIKPYKT